MASSAPAYNLLMLSGDSSIARGVDGAFYQMLAHFAAYWHRIDILTPTAPDAQPRTIHGNVHVHPAPRHRILQPLFIKRKGDALFAERRYHLLTSHDFGFFYNGLGASWLLRGQAMPLVSEIHHIEGFPIATTPRERLWRRAAQNYIPFIAHRGAHFRVVNQQVAAQLRRYGVADDKIHLLHSLYIDLEHYRPKPTEKQYDVLFVGRLSSNKGVMLLLQAIQQVKQTHSQILLAIRGEGDLKPQMLAYIEAHQLQANVQFLPRIADSHQMPTLYRHAKMLVCASTVEGNPRVTVEAMACGVPVISTPVGIMPDVIMDGENGLLVDWDANSIATAIRHLLDDEAFAQTIAEHGHQTAQQFDAESIIEAYASAYHSIIADHHSK